MPCAVDLNDSIKIQATQFGAKSHEFHARAQVESKRAQNEKGLIYVQPQVDEDVLELEPDIMEAVLANLNLIPLDVLVDATLQILLSFDQKVWDQQMKVCAF